MNPNRSLSQAKNYLKSHIENMRRINSWYDAFMVLRHIQLTLSTYRGIIYSECDIKS